MTEMFSKIDLSREITPGICDECSREAVEHVPSGVVFAHCQHRMTGSYRKPGGEWEVQQPISTRQFRGGMLMLFLEWDFQQGERKAAAH